MPTPLPALTKDSIQLADWIELQALTSGDGSANTGQLERALRRTGTFDPDAPEEGEVPHDSDHGLIEGKVDEVFAELEDRAQAADSAYPFEVSRAEVKTKGHIEQYIPYVFCLCLSMFGDGAKRLNIQKDDDGDPADDLPTYPRRLFEHIATIAAANYIGGEAVRFGSPRRGMSPSFIDALNELSWSHLHEGDGYNNDPIFGSKDRHLDIVAWKDFPDQRTSKLVLFGQCATNKDDGWHSKKPELQTGVFWGNWIKGAAVSELIRAFFIPHRVTSEEWNMHAREAGLFFDRCRVARFASMAADRSLTHDSGDWDSCLEWVSKMMSVGEETAAE